MSYGQADGPSPMALGPFHFRALGFSFKDVSKQVDTSWAELEVVSDWNRLHWTGPKSLDFSIRGCLFPKEYGGLDQLRGIERMARNGIPLMLVTAAGHIRGFQAIQSINEDMSAIDASGMPWRDQYEISCRKYPGVPGAGMIVSSLISFF